MTMMMIAPRRRSRLLTWISVVCFVAGMLLSAHAWLQRATAPAARPHAVLRITLPGLDLGADAWPANAGAAAYVELWAAPHDADDYQVLVQLPGAPALPVRPKIWPGEIWV